MWINAASSENNKAKKDVNNIEEVGCPIYNDKSDVAGSEIEKEESLKYFLTYWIGDAYLRGM